MALVALQMVATFSACAYTSMAGAPDELRKTLVIVKGLATQADADRESIEHCRTVANALKVGYAASSCRVVFRQTVAGNGSVACDDRICASGMGTDEQSARANAVERCKKNSKAAARCAIITSMDWRDDKVSTQAELDAAEAAKSSGANISNDRASLYGLAAGKTLLSSIPPCAGEPLAKGQPYCHNDHESIFDDPNAEMVSALHLRRLDVLINAQMFDVTSLYHNRLFGTFAWAQTWVAKDGVIRRLRFQTSLVEAETIKANLVQKFGKPTHEALLDWLDPRTGQVVQQTPRYTWDTSDYRVFFDARAAGLGDQGTIEMFDTSLLKQIREYQNKKAPQQRGM